MIVCETLSPPSSPPHPLNQLCFGFFFLSFICVCLTACSQSHHCCFPFFLFKCVMFLLFWGWNESKGSSRLPTLHMLTIHKSQGPEAAFIFISFFFLLHPALNSHLAWVLINYWCCIKTSPSLQELWGCLTRGCSNLASKLVHLFFISTISVVTPHLLEQSNRLERCRAL